MYLNMAEKANSILKKYHIRNYPIPLEIIENIITNEDIAIEITGYLKRALYFENDKKVIFIGQAISERKKREYLVHETAHYYHCGNIAYVDSYRAEKEEGQAQAFTAYFLMPIGIFEQYWVQEENDYSLSEIFGVTYDLVLFRKELSYALMMGGDYERLKVNFF